MSSSSTHRPSLGRLAGRLRRWLRAGTTSPGVPRVAVPTKDKPPAGMGEGPGHAPGHAHTGPPPPVPVPREHDRPGPHDQPWVPTGGLTDGRRRSERRD
jgi:hypothetical protein